MLTVLALVIVLWHQIGHAVHWWWDTATGATSGLGYGELVLFVLGLFAALVVTVLVFGALVMLLDVVVRSLSRNQNSREL